MKQARSHLLKNISNSSLEDEPDTDEDEVQLIEAAKHDAAAFDKLYRRYPATQSSNPLVVLAQPMAFDFDVPFQPNQILTLDQTISNGSTKMTLDKVGITPLGARFYLKRTIANQKGYEDAFSDNKFLSAN